MGQQSSVRALERGLEIIQLLNQHNGLTVTQVGQLTGLPRPTAFRLLRTLEGLGYLFRDPRDKKYRLTAQVRTLSHGYDQEEWIPKIARPIMETLCRQVLWPVSIATNMGTHMLVRDTTDEISPFSVYRNPGGFKIPILNTASGSVYLAYCSPHVREELIGHAQANDPKALSRGGSNMDLFSRMLETTYDEGYCCMKVVDQNHNALAVPLIVDGDIFGTVSLRFFTSAMSLQQAVERYLKPLRDAANQMGRELTEWRARLPDANVSGRA